MAGKGLWPPQKDQSCKTAITAEYRFIAAQSCPRSQSTMTSAETLKDKKCLLQREASALLTMQYWALKKIYAFFQRFFGNNALTVIAFDVENWRENEMS